MLYFIRPYLHDPQLALIVALAFGVALVFGLCFHEFSHALVGDTLGDQTPRRQGRLSLNPWHHLDPMGTFMLLFAPIGWAKPVQVNPRAFRIPAGVGMALVGAAGPISNFFLAAAAAAPIKAEVVQLSGRSLDFWDFGNYFAFFLYFLVIINVTLGVFNLLPIPPLDGSRLAQLIPGPVGEFFREMERGGWGFGILFLLLAIPFFTNGRFNPIGAIIDPIRSRILDALLNG